MTRFRHFLDLDLLDAATLRGILDHAVALKSARARHTRGTRDATRLLEGRILAMVFEKKSLRTRVSFDVAMRQLGGDTIVLRGDELQLGRGETVADTARVLSRYVDAIMLRTDNPAKLKELAEHATVPVINGLTDASHPCQVMTDVMTFEEKKGPIRDRVISWIGDGNNMAVSWIHAAVRFGFELRLACPAKLSPPKAIMDWAAANQGRVSLTADPKAAVAASDCVVTDTWISMGNERGDRPELLKPYQVNAPLMALAKPDALFMHCLPAHRGEEVTAEVMDSPGSVVFDEAENRVHAQKAILAWCLG